MIKTVSLNKVLAALLLVLSMFGLQSCSRNDNPVTPTNETTDKGHDEWEKVEFIFKEGHLHGRNFHGDPDYPESVKYFNRSQKITFSRDANGEVKANRNEPIYLLGGNSYAIIINYYNTKGELMNKEFVEGDMVKIHQHFFYAENIKATKKEASKASNSLYLFDYVYRDTDPYDYKQEGLIKNLRKRTWDPSNPEGEDPVGLKGYITIPNKTYRQKFDLKVILAHFKVENKLNKNTKKPEPYKFNDKPAPGIYATDLSLKIPIVIYSTIDFQETEEKKENDFFPDAAETFHTTVDEIKKMYDLIFELDSEGSTFWL